MAGGNVPGRQLRVELELVHYDYLGMRSVHIPLNTEKFQMLLEPLESLKGLKSATVTREGANTYAAELEDLMEGGAVWDRRNRKAEIDKEKVVVKQQQTNDWQENRSGDF